MNVGIVLGDSLHVGENAPHDTKNKAFRKAFRQAFRQAFRKAFRETSHAAFCADLREAFRMQSYRELPRNFQQQKKGQRTSDPKYTMNQRAPGHTINF